MLLVVSAGKLGTSSWFQRAEGCMRKNGSRPNTVRATELNEYFQNATYNFSRSAALILQHGKAHEIEDAVMFFAFGVERCFKGILYDINPIFMLESSSFENANAVLYRDKLVNAEREKVDKEAGKASGLNRNQLPFKASMLRAAKFSQTVEDNIGAFAKLSDFRGIIAHRTLSELDYGAAARFLKRYFHPVVEAFSSTIGLSIEECCGEAREKLAESSKRIIAEDNLRERLDKLFAKHLEIWEQREADTKTVARAERETEKALKDDSQSGTRFLDYTCPACENVGLLWIEEEWEAEGATGHGYLTGVYVAGFECKFCDLELNDFEEFDFLKLNERLSSD